MDETIVFSFSFLLASIFRYMNNFTEVSISEIVRSLNSVQSGSRLKHCHKKDRMPKSIIIKFIKYRNTKFQYNKAVQVREFHFRCVRK